MIKTGKNKKDIFCLALHESITIHDNELTKVVVTRVPGGWIYTESYGIEFGGLAAHCGISKVFVPYTEKI